MPRKMVKRLLVGESEHNTIYLREKASHGQRASGTFLRRRRGQQSRGHSHTLKSTTLKSTTFEASVDTLHSGLDY